MGSYSVVSSDSHVFEPGNLWTERAEARFKDRAPRIQRFEDGEWWVCDGNKVVGLGAGAQAGKRFEEPENMTLGDETENLRPGGWIPEEHMKDMDIDGIDVGIVYPTAGLLLYGVPDSDLLTNIFRIYNDWVAEFCSALPKRIKGIAALNIDDVQVGVMELQRCHKMGLVGAMITVYPLEERAYNSPEYEPLWAAAQDLGMPLSLHLNTPRSGPDRPFVSLDSAGRAFFTNIDHWVRMSLANMIFSGVFERYPRLQVGSIEMELSWVPHFLDRLDYNYTQRPPFGDTYMFKEDALPSDYFHRNVFLSFQEDGQGIRDRNIIGVDKLMWGSDYPHFESTFPRSREIIEEILADCSDEEKAKIAGGNAARVYNLN